MGLWVGGGWGCGGIVRQRQVWFWVWLSLRWGGSAAPTTATLPPWLQAIIAGLRESVATFQDQVTDVNSRDVMELLLITQASPARSCVAAAGGHAMNC